MKTDSPLKTRTAFPCALGALVALIVCLDGGEAFAAAGDLDPGFATNGMLIGGEPERAEGIAVQPDGKIVLVGPSSDSTPDVVVRRLNPDGSPDPSFDGDGLATLASPGYQYANAVTIQPDGKIVVAGTAFSGLSDPRHAVVYRLNSSGSLDTSFDTDGVAGMDSGGINESAEAVALQPDGRIVVVGRTDNGVGGTYDALVYRLMPNGGPGTVNGALDTGFDGDGELKINSGVDELADAVAVQLDGKIVVAGSSDTSVPVGDAVVYRVNSTGGLDSSFDTDGAAGIDSGGNESAYAVALQPDGKIVIGGDTSTNGYYATVYRLKPNGGPGTLNGALDTTFDTDGAAGFDNGDAIEAIALQPDGKIVAAGYADDGAGTTEDAVVYRVNANGGPGTLNGALDTTFAGDGAVLLDAGLGVDEYAYSIALQPDRRIVVGATEGLSGLAVFRLFGDPFTVSVTRVGSGSGSVSSIPPGINCGATCSSLFEAGTQLTLTATADAGSTFGGWSGGGCSGTAPCTFTVGTDAALTATFDRPSGGTASARCAGRRATKIGTSGKDKLRGTRRRDVIAALGGNDTVRGLAGNDLICGGRGKDKLLGGVGKDRLRGDAGNDNLLGGKGKDTLLGGKGKDRLRGGPGRDKLRGGPGRDTEAQ